MQQPIRVLHVFGAMNRGGAESRTMDLYRAIDRTQVQFDFMVHTDKPCAFDAQIRALGGHIYYVPRYRIYNHLAYQKAWRSFLRQHPYTIAHVHITNVAGAILPVLQKHDVNMRITHARCAADTGIRKRVAQWSRKKINRLSTVKLAVSTEAARFVFGDTAVDVGQVQVIPNAIDARKYTFDPALRETTRIQLQLQNAFVIGHVGRFDSNKNHAFLLEVFHAIAPKYPNAVLLLVGTGPLQPEMRALAAQLGIAEKVRFLDVRDDVPALMQAFDLLLLPSISEGLPGVALEAQAAGLACLLADTITRECAIVPALCRFLPIDQGVMSWVKAIEEDGAKSRADTYGDFVEKGFDAKGQAQRYLQTYLSGIQKGGKG